MPGRRRTLALEALEGRTLMSASSLVFPGPDGHLQYVPDARGNTIPDFSNVGYESGVVPLPGTNGTPDVPVKAIVQPLAKGVDAGAAIQAAIDQVSKLPVDANGFRGAVLLKAGLYPIKGQIRITTSGVVLRGEGADPPDTTSTGTVKVPVTGLTGTVLEATGTDQRYNANLPFGDGLVQLEGAVPKGTNWNGGDDFTQLAVAGTTHNLTDDYVPVGARSFHVDSIAGLSVGDSVIVHRPSPANWIHDLGMDVSKNAWLPGTKDLESDRVITQIDAQNNLITIDAPLTDALEQKYGGGTIFKYSFPGRIDHVGVENLSGFSDFDPTVRDKSTVNGNQGNPTDENHAWTFISLAGVENAWVRNVTAQHFAFSAVDVQKMSKWVTIEDSQSIAPVSVITGGRRYSFEIGGQLTLVKDCNADHGRHDFVLHSLVPGPVAFVHCTAVDAYDESGPHHRWDTGVLFDNVTVSPVDPKTDSDGDQRTAGTLEAHNQGMADGHGWSGANIVFWNCTAAKVDVGKPPTAQNWAIGDTTKPGTTPTGTGFIESSNKRVDPDSLYLAQLKDRLARDFGTTGQVRVMVRPVPSQANAFSVTITNVSNKPLSGPILIVFTSLPKGVGLADVSGFTAAGDPFVAASLTGLLPGQSVTAQVRFRAPPSTGTAVEILAGLPQPLTLPPPHLDPIIAPPTPAAGGLPSSPSALDSLFVGWTPSQLATLTGRSVP
jgi:hypothetical protein